MRRSAVAAGATAAAVLVAGAVVGLSYGPPADAAPVLTAADLPSPPVPTAGGTTVLETAATHDGRPRTVVVHVPEGLLAPAPLVVALHARAQTAASIRAYSRLEQLADEQGFVVAFPSGAAGSWNAGTCCAPGTEQRVDDVAFLDDVLRVVRERVAVDPARISFSGSSNGGMMALRYACERSSVVASVAVVSAPLVATCSPTDPVPVLALHGELDAVVPLAGGANAALGTVFPDLRASLQPFAASGGEVDVRVVRGAGHTWFTRDEHGADASASVWDWARDHPRVTPAAGD